MTDFFRRRFHEDHISAELLESSSSIQPVIIGDNSRLIAVNEGLRNQGILCGAIRPPTVPKGTARLRITITAAHMEEDIVRLTEALGEISQ
jgi:8-amino-7-oxononanoate synthase